MENPYCSCRLTCVRGSVGKLFPAQFVPYLAFGCNLEEYFDGTLFRFPLRTAEQASSSNLSAHGYSAERILGLFDDFKAKASSTILFLQHVQSVSLYTWDDGQAEPQPVFASSVRNRSKQLDDQRRMLRILPTLKMKEPAALFELQVDCTEQGDTTTTGWLICQLMGQGESKQMAEAVSGDRLGLSLVPWGGVAARLVPAHESALGGNAYCFLPLPVRTGLPVHVNGSFELSANRRDIWFGHDMTGDGQLRSDWNVALLRDVVAPAYTRMLKQAAGVLGWNEQYFQLWPTEIGAEPWSFVTREVYSIGCQVPLLHSDVGGGRWVSALSAVFADTSVPYARELNEALILEGLALVCPPDHVCKMFHTAQDTQLQIVTPAFVRQLLSGPGEHPALANREHVLLLLRYCLSDLAEATYSEMVGLPLLPTADGKVAKFGASDDSVQIYTCSGLEGRLLESCRQWLVDRELPEELYLAVSAVELQTATNVRTLNPRTMARLFEMGVMPKQWKRCAEVEWSPGTDGQPSTDWVCLFWEFAHASHVDLSCFEEWPLLPCSGGVLRGLIEQTCVIDMAEADVKLRGCLKTLGCRELDTDVVVAGPAAMLSRSYVRPCTADGVLAALAEVGREMDRFLMAAFISLESEERRMFRSFISGQYMNGWRATEQNVVFLKSLPIYEAYNGVADDSDFVDLKETRWIPPQGAAADLLNQRCLKLVLGEDASLYECLGVSPATETGFYKEFVFPHRLKELDGQAHDTVMVGLLRELPRLVGSDPEMQKDLARLPFIETESGVRKCPTALYHPGLKDALAALLDTSESIPSGVYCDDPKTLEACVLAGLQTKIGRQTLIDSAKAITGSLPEAASRQSKALLAYLDRNYQEVMTTQDVTDIDIHSFQKELHELRWLPVRYDPPYAFLPWPVERSAVAKAADVCTEENTWIASHKLYVLDAEVQSRELMLLLNIGTQVSIEVQTEQLVKLSDASDRLTDSGDKLLFARHMDEVIDRFFDAFNEFAFNDSLEEQAQFESCCRTLRGHAWFWNKTTFLPSRAVAFSSDTNASPYLCAVDMDSDYEELFRQLGVRDAFEPRDYTAVLIQIATEYGDRPVEECLLAVVLGIVSHIGAHAAELGRTLVYLPDTRGCMVPASELLFNDANWLSDSLEGRADIKLAHPDIERLVAETLGSRSLRQMLSADSSLSMTYIGCPSVADVRSNLCTASSANVLLELLDTADVCGAADIQFILDFRSHPAVSLLQPTLAQFQGPSLCIFLPDVVLTHKDMSELLHPRAPSFHGDPCRYGRGLLSCFQLGDVMSVVAGESYYLFDPAGKYLLDEDSFGDEGQHSAVGKEYQYVASGLSSRFPDQFAPFSGAFRSEHHTLKAI